MNKHLTTAVVAVLLLAAPLANAATINVEATTVDSFGAGAPTVLDSYATRGPTGIGIGGAINRRFGLFAFDLGGVANTVVGATLELQRYGASFSFLGGATLADLKFQTTDHLTNYGNFSFDISTGATTDVLSFVLNANALIDINAALGGNFELISGTGSTFFNLFNGSSSAGTQRLVLETTVVPVPGALLLYASALFGLGLVRKTRSKV